MTKFLCLLLLGFPLVACDDIGHFFNDRPPCSNTCFKKPQFQNCQVCNCQPGQENIENHVCCQAGACIKPPAAINPQCMNPDDGNVYLAISQPTPIPNLAECGQTVSINWDYFNTSTGVLKASANLNLLVPFLNLHEQDTAESTDVTYPNQDWPQLASCGQWTKTQVTEALVPQSHTPSNFIAQVRQLPANTVGTDYVGFIVNVTKGNPQCPPL